MELSIEQGCLLWGCRTVIPEACQKSILNELHVAHPGMVRMKALAGSHVWWPYLDRDIKQMAKECTTCLKVKHQLPVAPLTPWQFPARPWQRLHVNLAKSEQQDYMVQPSTWCPETTTKQNKKNHNVVTQY